MNRRAIDRIAGLALLIGMPLLAACRDSAPPSSVPPAGEVPRRGGTAVVATSTDLIGVNELLAGPSPLAADVLRRLLFAQLLDEQADYAEHPPTFAPDLAERFEWSADRKTLTLFLRPEAVWSDGVPITAEDVLFTFDAQRSAEIAWEYAYAKQSIERMEAVDERTVRVHFARPSLSQLTDLNEGAVLPKHVWSALPFSQWRQNPGWFRQHLVTSGPFAIEAWTPQQELVLRRNERYFRSGQPYLDRLVFRVLPDRESQLLQLLAGDVDYIELLTPPEARRVRASGRAAIESYWSRQFNFVAWNLRRPQLADARVRRALTLATDRQGLIDALADGAYRIAASPILSGVWARNPAVQPLPYDPAQARRLFAEAGWEDRDGDGFLDRQGKRFRIELTTNSESPIRKDAVLLMQEQLRRVGVEATPRFFEYSTLAERNARGEFDGTLQAFVMDTSLDLSYAFATAADQNWGGYSNAEVDRLLRAFQDIADVEEARRCLYRIQEILHTDQPFTFLWEPQRSDGRSRRLRNVHPTVIGAYVNAREWWLDSAIDAAVDSSKRR